VRLLRPLPTGSDLAFRIGSISSASPTTGDYFRATVGPAASGVGVPPRAKSKPARPARGSAGYPGEVDEAALDVGVDELHAYPIADVEILEALHHFPLR
jgi:hypothetical protein